MLRTLKDRSKEQRQTWQILDWPSTLVFGLMMDGMLACLSFFLYKKKEKKKGSV